MLKRIGPGFVIAATGLGAGDLIAASVAGAQHDTVIIWAVLFGSIIKFVLNEGIARWQLVTGNTVLEGWIRYLPRFIPLYFLIYLVLWSFIVAGALIAACGLAAHSLAPQLSIIQWGIIHSLCAAALVLAGRYQWLENIMKVLMIMMFSVVLLCAILIKPDWSMVIHNLLLPGKPDASIVFILGVIGGVGGSVTLLSYGYWIREKGWTSTNNLRTCRLDLAIAYGLTGFFGMAIMIIAAHAQPEITSGSQMLLGLADSLQSILGPYGKWLFLSGFWAAVFTSMLGVWHGVPYLFADFVLSFRQHGSESFTTKRISRSSWYYGFLAYMSMPPIVLVLLGKPLWIVIAYTVIGAFFMPVLAALLLYMNNQPKWMPVCKNGWLLNSLLIVTLAIFSVLLISEIISSF